MHRNNIDEIFNSGLKDQHFEIEDVYLNDLENRLKKNKKRPVFFWFLSTIGVLAIVLVANSLFFNSESKPQDFNSESKNNHRISQNSIPKSEIKNVKEENDFISPKNNPAVKIVSGHYTTSNEESERLSRMNYPSENLSSGKSVFNPTSILESHTSRTSETNNDDEDLTEDNTDIAIIESQEEEEEEEIIAATKNLVVEEVTPIGRILEEQKNEPTNSLSTDNLNYSTPSTFANTSAIGSDSTNNNQQASNIPTKVEEIPKKNKALKLLLSIDAGVNLNQAKYGGIESDYYNANNREEKFTLNYEFNANILFKNSIVVGTGLGVNKQEYNYDYDYSSTTYDTTYFEDSIYILDYYVFQGGQIYDSVYHYVYILNTSIDSTVTPTNSQGLTQAKYITIPLNIGYSFTYKKFMFGFYASARFNILQNYKGAYYNNNSLHFFDSNTNPLFKKSYVSFSFKTKIAYNLYKNIYLHGSIGYSPYSSSVFKAPDIQRRLQTYNASFGITYKL